jgi:hypothetical protein
MQEIDLMECGPHLLTDTRSEALLGPMRVTPTRQDKSSSRGMPLTCCECPCSSPLGWDQWACRSPRPGVWCTRCRAGTGWPAPGPPARARAISPAHNTTHYSIILDADPDPRSVAFLTPGSGNRFFRIPNPQPIFLRA